MDCNGRSSDHPTTPGLDFHIDLGAVKDVIRAEKGEEQIAVEVKSLKGNSVFYDYHQALGQFMMYRLALKMTKKKHILYLGIPENEYARLKKVEIYGLSWKEYQVNLLIINVNNKTIAEWINN